MAEPEDPWEALRRKALKDEEADPWEALRQEAAAKKKPRGGVAQRAFVNMANDMGQGEINRAEGFWGETGPKATSEYEEAPGSAWDKTQGTIASGALGAYLAAGTALKGVGEYAGQGLDFIADLAKKPPPKKRPEGYDPRLGELEGGDTFEGMESRGMGQILGLKEAAELQPEVEAQSYANDPNMAKRLGHGVFADTMAAAPNLALMGALGPVAGSVVAAFAGQKGETGETDVNQGIIEAGKLALLGKASNATAGKNLALRALAEAGVGSGQDLATQVAGGQGVDPEQVMRAGLGSLPFLALDAGQTKESVAARREAESLQGKTGFAERGREQAQLDAATKEIRKDFEKQEAERVQAEAEARQEALRDQIAKRSVDMTQHVADEHRAPAAEAEAIKTARELGLSTEEQNKVAQKAALEAKLAVKAKFVEPPPEPPPVDPAVAKQAEETAKMAPHVEASTKLAEVAAQGKPAVGAHLGSTGMGDILTKLAGHHNNDEMIQRARDGEATGEDVQKLREEAVRMGLPDPFGSLVVKPEPVVEQQVPEEVDQFAQETQPAAEAGAIKMARELGLPSEEQNKVAHKAALEAKLAVLAKFVEPPPEPRPEPVRSEQEPIATPVDDGPVVPLGSAGGMGAEAPGARDKFNHQVDPDWVEGLARTPEAKAHVASLKQLLWDYNGYRSDPNSLLPDLKDARLVLPKLGEGTEVQILVNGDTILTKADLQKMLESGSYGATDALPPEAREAGGRQRDREVHDLTNFFFRRLAKSEHAPESIKNLASRLIVRDDWPAIAKEVVEMDSRMSATGEKTANPAENALNYVFDKRYKDIDKELWRKVVDVAAHKKGSNKAGPMSFEEAFDYVMTDAEYMNPKDASSFMAKDVAENPKLYEDKLRAVRELQNQLEVATELAGLPINAESREDGRFYVPELMNPLALNKMQRGLAGNIKNEGGMRGPTAKAMGRMKEALHDKYYFRMKGEERPFASIHLEKVEAKREAYIDQAVKNHMAKIREGNGKTWTPSEQIAHEKLTRARIERTTRIRKPMAYRERVAANTMTDLFSLLAEGAQQKGNLIGKAKGWDEFATHMMTRPDSTTPAWISPHKFEGRNETFDDDGRPVKYVKINGDALRELAEKTSPALKRFLNGYMREDVARVIEGEIKVRSGLAKYWGAVEGYGRKGVTAWKPSRHVRGPIENIVSHSLDSSRMAVDVMAELVRAGKDFAVQKTDLSTPLGKEVDGSVLQFVRMIEDAIPPDADYVKLNELGIFDSGFLGNGWRRTLQEGMTLNDFKDSNPAVRDQMLRKMRRSPLGQAAIKAGWSMEKWYHIEDMYFKVHAYKWHMKKDGMSSEASIQRVKDFQFDFVNMPPWVKAIAAKVPFTAAVSWNFARILGNHFNNYGKAHAIKTGVKLGLLAFSGPASSAVFGPSGEERERMGKMAPNRWTNFYLPGTFEDGSSPYIGTGWAIPFGSALFNWSSDWRHALINSTGVMTRPIAEVVMNEDAFGREISPDKDNGWQRTKNIGTHVAKGMVFVPGLSLASVMQPIEDARKPEERQKGFVRSVSPLTYGNYGKKQEIQEKKRRGFEARELLRAASAADRKGDKEAAREYRERARAMLKGE